MIKIKKNILSLLICILIASFLSSCNLKKCKEHIDSDKDEACDNCGQHVEYICSHEWIEATCTDAKICKNCEQIAGNANGHKIVIDNGYEATCEKEGLTDGAHCETCNEVLVEQVKISLKEHVWLDATCENPKTCKICGKIEGEVLRHKWVEATCTDAKICKICGKIEGEPLGHKIRIVKGFKATCEKEGLTDGVICGTCNKILLPQESIPALNIDRKHEWTEATCEHPKTCYICGQTEGYPLGHNVLDKDCSIEKICSVCNKFLKEPTEHIWENATYLKPKTCIVCGKTEGSKLICPNHKDNDGDKICEFCGTEVLPYESKWKPNTQIGSWNGKGMLVKILVYPKHNYDPFDERYIYSDKKIMQKQIRLVEAAYGIDIEFEDWPDYAPWGPARINYIRDGGPSGGFSNNDTYVVSINSTWIPNLIKVGCLAELAEIDNQYNAKSGIYTEIGYQEAKDGSGGYVPGIYSPQPIKNELTASLSKVFGYIKDDVRPDYFMYYNADLIADANMIDPAELWLRGEWTWSNFELYCQQLQAKLPANCKALSVGFPEFIIGSVASTGGKIATTRPSLALTSLNVINQFKVIQNLYVSGSYEFGNFEDVSTGFLDNSVAFVHGSLWFLGNPSRFDPNQCHFRIGSVPYPTADGEGGKPIITTNVDEAIVGYDGYPIELEPGSKEYIAGVDMSASTYNVPFGGAECFSIIDTPLGKNGINNKILFAIIYDLYEGLGVDPENGSVDNDSKYYDWLLSKFDCAMYADVIMSVQDKAYYELIEGLSIIVGSGSHFGSNGFWTVAIPICTNKSIDPAIRLNEIVEEYEIAMSNWIIYD